MVALPAVALLDVLFAITMAIIAYGAYRALVWALSGLAEPLAFTGVDFLAVSQRIGYAVAGLADAAARGLYSAAAQTIAAPASNALFYLRSVRGAFYAVGVALIHVQTHIAAIYATVGTWVFSQTISETVVTLWHDVNAATAAVNTLSGSVGSLASSIYNTVVWVSQALDDTLHNAVSQAQTYTNARISPIESTLDAAIRTYNADIATLNANVQTVEREALSAAQSSLSTSESYTNSQLAAFESVLVQWVGAQIAGAESSLNDRISAITNALQSELGGVSDALKAELTQVASQAASEDAALSTDLKTAIASIAAQAQGEVNQLSGETRSAIADVTAQITATRQTLSSALTADVAQLTRDIVTSEGALSDTLTADIDRVAQEAQAARAALASSLTQSIASVAATATATATRVAADEANCLTPLCDSFGQLIPDLLSLIAVGESGEILSLVAAAIADPQATAPLVGDALQEFAGPLYDETRGYLG